MGDVPGTAQPFRFGAFIAARGRRPSINVGILPPNISHALRCLNLSRVVVLIVTS
jgi:hypothetical protein